MDNDDHADDSFIDVPDEEIPTSIQEGSKFIKLFEVFFKYNKVSLFIHFFHRKKILSQSQTLVHCVVEERMKMKLTALLMSQGAVHQWH